MRDDPVCREAFVCKAAIALAWMAWASSALAADAGNGKRLAEAQCASCHTIAPQPRDEVADAPPFVVIGRKYGFDPDALGRAIAGPHPKMNFSPHRTEADDVAAYIATLVKQSVPATGAMLGCAALRISEAGDTGHDFLNRYAASRRVGYHGRGDDVVFPIAGSCRCAREEGSGIRLDKQDAYSTKGVSPGRRFDWSTQYCPSVSSCTGARTVSATLCKASSRRAGRDCGAAAHVVPPACRNEAQRASGDQR
jgi:mono/diheme cytochrome c family protein